jgi:DNA-binding MarR family transcriptional regulator
VERVVSPSDRRFTYAQLTPWGEEQCAKLVPSIVDFMDTTCSAISEQEMLMLTSILARVRRDLQKRYGLEL